MAEANTGAGSMEEPESSWCLIESDPGVFTELIRGFGCTGAQVEEIWTLEVDAFRHLEPIHGLIFLFKWVQDDKPAGRVVHDRSDIFFARQMIQNACATQALLSLLLNIRHPDIDLGHTLNSFKHFCQELDPVSRGICLSNEEKIRTVHNSFARPELFELDTPDAPSEDDDDDVYHFVSYMPIKGRLFELDGMHEGPIELADIGQDQNWLQVVRPFIEARMQRYSVGEIHFNLMALVSDRQRYYERQIQLLVHQPSPLSHTERQAEIAKLRTFVTLEQEKKRRYRQENQRRRHNYLPFIVEVLKQLGETGQLMPIYEKAKKQAKEQANQEQACNSPKNEANQEP
ncbi:ubiquitin carboxyl-terminal hydrolase isozyme L5 [Drosophila rhopaloa]|uniref:Ubiquitin carboxyl-terminal hydrolase n=1 Tax=Drosophila rhopaloa TaxID=1041015 RepID=A0A6P4DZH4_DRORH|nr:ubiquitin carboxyl-terminal hydrolase isozyme L5 [Drosophila rhopaloa]